MGISVALYKSTWHSTTRFLANAIRLITSKLSTKVSRISTRLSSTFLRLNSEVQQETTLLMRSFSPSSSVGPQTTSSGRVRSQRILL